MLFISKFPIFGQLFTETEPTNPTRPQHQSQQTVQMSAANLKLQSFPAEIHQAMASSFLLRCKKVSFFRSMVLDKSNQLHCFDCLIQARIPSSRPPILVLIHTSTGWHLVNS